MEFRKIFDTIPEQFDRWRKRYCAAAFNCIIETVGLDERKSVLEIGPGTGQATEPLLRTGCRYQAVELGEHLYEFTKNKFAAYSDFRIFNDDFITRDFGAERFDLVFSAATIQWIPEEIAFPKCFDLLTDGGYLAMMKQHDDYKTPNEALYTEIQQVYDAWFHPETPYTQRFTYENAVRYGFTDLKRYTFPVERRFTADEYVAYLGTHCDHLTLREPDKSRFFDGIRSAILRHGNLLVSHDTVVLYLTRKPTAE